jgi:hypothetical protein
MFAGGGAVAPTDARWWGGLGDREEGRAVVVPLKDLVRWFLSTRAAVAAAEQRLALAVSCSADSASSEWLR